MADTAQPITDYLGAEPLIVARLAERLSDLPGVQFMRAADLEGLAEAAIPTPSVHVLYHTEAGVDPKAGGRVVEVTQTWLAVVCIRNVAGDLRAGVAAREDAGPLVVRTARALIGWSPGAGLAALEMVRSPYRSRYSQGRLYIPLAFTTRFQLRGD